MTNILYKSGKLLNAFIGAVKMSTYVITSIVFLLLYLPIGMIAIMSIFKFRRGKINWETFSVESYSQIWGNDQLMTSLFNSLVVGLVASTIAVVLATLLSFATLSSYTSKTTRTIEFIVFLPFVLPPIVTGLSLLISFKEIGLSRGLIAVTIGHTAFVLAISYSTIAARLRSIGRNVTDASYDLGASRWQTLRFVIMPQMLSSLLIAGVLSFTLSVDETMISIFLVGDTSTLPIRLYSLMRVGFTPEVNALVTLILILTSGLAVASSRVFIRNNGVND